MSKQPTISITVGQRFGRLTVTARHVQDSAAGFPRWNCTCDCGWGTTVLASHLRSGATASCGCQRKAGLTRRTHGMRHSPEYAAWSGLRARCLNPRNTAYPNYGGRGITFCPAWQSFERFYADMGPRPSPEHSLDRIDNDGPYSADNCRWATRTEQNRNRRIMPRYQHDGLSLTLPEWAERTNIPLITLKYRLNLRGWPLARALTQPLRHIGNRGARAPR